MIGKMTSEILIAKQFYNSTFKNRAVFVLLFFVGLLFFYAMITGWLSYVKQTEIRLKYQAESRQDWVNNPNKHPHRMAHYGNFAFRPKAPLSIFDFGMESFLGNSIFLEAHVQNTTNFSEAEFSTGLLRFGEISAAMILQILLPLLIFFLGFGSIATERENGTLKILISQGLTWRKLIFGKSLGIIAVVMTLYLPILLTTFLLWYFLQNASIDLDEILRMLLIALSYLVYLSIFCVMAVVVSSLSKTSKIALVSLIGIWLLFTILLPRASQSLGSYLYEIPSKSKFLADIETDIIKTGDSHNPDDPHYKSLKDSLLTLYKVDSTKKLPFNYSGFVMREGEKISADIYNNHIKNLRSIYEKQNSFYRIMAFINPFLAIKNLSMALSGSDYATYQDFQNQSEQYRYYVSQHMTELQIKFVSNKAKSSADKNHFLDKKYWTATADFKYQSPKISDVFKNEFLSIFSLIAWVILLIGIINKLSKTLKPL
jgi:ABC-2 type transport system permease protein